MSKWIRNVVLAAGLCLCLSACGGKSFTDEDFKKVKSGMTEAEVVEILGKPDDSKEQDSPLGKTKGCSWKSNGKTYSVAFIDGKVFLAGQGNVDISGKKK
jgi:hypothetical protein